MSADRVPSSLSGPGSRSTPLSQAAVLVLLVLYSVLALQPLLSSGYYSDDLIHSSIRGEIALRNGSLFGHFIDANLSWIRTAGRCFPGNLAVVMTVPYYVSQLPLLKALILSLVILNILLFGRLIFALTKDRAISFLAMILAPLLFQFRLYHDPILSFSGLMQIFLSCILLSLICFARYAEEGRRSHAVWSAVFYNAALYTYEISIPLIALFIIMALAGDRPRSGDSVARLLALPIVSVVTALVVKGVCLALRDAAAAGYAGVMTSFHLRAVLKTLALQIYASLPLSYYASDPSRVFSHTANSFFENFRMSDLLPVIMLIAGYLSTARSITCHGMNRTLLMMGAVLILAPAAMVAVSVKYQEEIRGLGSGIGYVPVYVQYYGALFIAAGLLVSANSGAYVNHARVILHAAMIVILSMVILLNMQNNRIVVDRLNIDLHYRRAALTEALSHDILSGVPEAATVLIQDEYRYDPYPTVLSHAKVWARSYPWKNEALVYLFSGKRVSVAGDLTQMLTKKQREPGAEQAPKDLYLLRIGSHPSGSDLKEGYVVFGKVERIVPDADANNPLLRLSGSRLYEHGRMVDGASLTDHQQDCLVRALERPGDPLRATGRNHLIVRP